MAMRLLRLLLVTFVRVLVAGSVMAAGPAQMARSDRSLWPEPLDSPAAFDRASRAEILSFAAALAATEGLDATALAAELGIKSAHLESVRQWRASTAQRLAENFRRASEGCHADEWLCDPQMAIEGPRAAAKLDAALPERLRPWRENARLFHRAYAREQLRLAALFPHPTSEILTVSDAERTGFELPDRRFRLTFDDGPSPRGGTTDALLTLLRESRRRGTFFMLGERLEARQTEEKDEALRVRFEGQCVASHGARHVSHQGLPSWQASVLDTDVRLHATFGALYVPLFRPPYGQRKVDSAAFFAEHGLAVALWNIDSQDWSAALDARSVQDRVLSLMLLWRRGVILFHDIHDKAAQALPNLWRATDAAGVVWMDCRDDRPAEK
jgi:peptidoglycan/xylan/chitin deacetylase (PgdA/CDA1 family)